MYRVNIHLLLLGSLIGLSRGGGAGRCFAGVVWVGLVLSYTRENLNKENTCYCHLIEIWKKLVLVVFSIDLSLSSVF